MSDADLIWWLTSSPAAVFGRRLALAARLRQGRPTNDLLYRARAYGMGGVA